MTLTAADKGQLARIGRVCQMIQNRLGGQYWWIDPT